MRARTTNLAVDCVTTPVLRADLWWPPCGRGRPSTTEAGERGGNSEETARGARGVRSGRARARRHARQRGRRCPLERERAVQQRGRELGDARRGLPGPAWLARPSCRNVPSRALRRQPLRVLARGQAGGGGTGREPPVVLGQS